MGPGLLTTGLVLLATARYAASATYSKPTRLTGESFIDAFTWSTNADANWGRVNYVDLATAQSKKLVFVSGNKVTLRADSTTKLDPKGPGRDSFYLMSNHQYSTHVAMHVFPLCFPVHLTRFTVSTLLICPKVAAPGRPSEVGMHWPNGGEVDILEGVNNQSPDTITLHTGANCTMPSARKMSGTSQGTNCDVKPTENKSCGVTVNTPNSFGPSFNSAGGGWYAIERTPLFVKVFFWSRRSLLGVPSDVTNPGSTINTDNWGVPAAYFPSSKSCDFATHLGAFNIMIDLDFCGAWAGNSKVYSQSGCPSTCVDYVNSNPSAFNNAYFTFNTLTIYE